MKTAYKFLMGIFAPLMTLSNCSDTNTSVGLALSENCYGTFDDDDCDVEGGPVASEAPTGSGSSTEPFAASLCAQDSGSGTNPGLVLEAATDVTAASCDAATDITTTATATTVTVKADTSIDPAVTFSCTITRPSGSETYYFSIEAEDCCCFVGDTLVLMADGTSKPIREIRVGDHVMTADGENWVEAVQQPRLGNRLLYAINGSSPFVTSEHNFMTLEGWKAIDREQSLKEFTKEELPIGGIGQLREGDVLVLHENKKLFVEAIQSQSADPQLPLYHLLINGPAVTANYFVAVGDKGFALVDS